MRVPSTLSSELEALGAEVVNCIYQVHSALGPGLLESVYEACLCHELSRAGIPFQKQVSLPVIYRDCKLDTGLRLDLVVGNSIIVELKAVEKLAEIHTAQVLTYLKLSGFRLGYLVNFNVTLIKHGIRRVVI